MKKIFKNILIGICILLVLYIFIKSAKYIIVFGGLYFLGCALYNFIKKKKQKKNEDLLEKR